MLWIWILFGCSWIIQPCHCSDNNHIAFSSRDGKGWGTDSSTFFDIALTALAFLSFGIFLLNLLVNALLYPSSGSGGLTSPDPILTMVTGGGTGGAIVTGKTFGRGLRRQRALFSPEIDHFTSAKVLASFVTNSIETMSRKHECIPQVFCEGNRKARMLPSGYKFLVPVFSLSMSWVGKVLKLHNDLPAHLKAIRLGMKEVNCQSYYPKCGK